MLIWDLSLAVFLLLNIVVGLARILRGPTAVDCMLAAQLLGTGGVALLLVLASGLNAVALYDGALVLALLAAVTTVAFVKRLRSFSEREGD
jgi:multicomponent Na+:H+ antiporter subunit F